MATERLLGTETEVGGNLLKNYFRLSKFTAIATGVMSEIKVYSINTTYDKVAIYADNGGEPGVLITANNDDQLVLANQWNTLTIGNTNIVKDTVYWLAANLGDDRGLTTGAAGTGTDRYKVAAYSLFTFPNPAGTGFSSLTRAYDIAGWGTVAKKTRSYGLIIG